MYTDRCSGERSFWMSLNFSRKSGKRYINIFIGNHGGLHFTTAITSFGRSPKLGRNWFTLMPRFSFRRSMSHLFKNRISCVFASSLEAQIEVHKMIESSRRFTLWSSSRRWSKTDTGDTEKKNQTQVDQILLLHSGIYGTYKKWSRSRCQSKEATPCAVGISANVVL